MGIDVNLRGDHPRYEKLVWQGEHGGQTVRVRIVQYNEGDIIWTVVECNARTGEGVDRWMEANAWGQPTMNDPLSFFVEGFIDMLGRPEWDTRPKATSAYPYELKAGIEW